MDLGGCGKKIIGIVGSFRIMCHMDWGPRRGLRIIKLLLRRLCIEMALKSDYGMLMLCML